MQEFIERITGKGFSLLISLFFLWILVQIGMSGYTSVYNELSGINKEKTEIKSFYDTVDVIIVKQEIQNNDVIRIYNYHNRISDGLLEKNGIANSYDDYILHRQYDDSKETRNNEKSNLSKEQTKRQSAVYEKNITFLKGAVEQLRITQPYTVLPLREKMATQHLHLALEDLADKKSLKYFDDLKLVMEQRYEEYKLIDQASEQNKIFSWISILLAVLSLFVPIFGWKRIFKTFKGKRNNGLETEKEKIKQITE